MLKVILSLFVALSFSMAFADTIYVAPVTGASKAGKSDRDSLRELIQVAVQGYPEHKIAATPDKADFQLQTKLIKFDQYTLSMSKWKGNQKVASNQWKARNRGELEGVVNSAVAEIVDGQSSGKSSARNRRSSLADRANEKQQKQKFERVQAHQQVLFAFGPTYYSNMNTADTALGLAFGYFWNINDSVDLGLQSDFSISTTHSDANMIAAKILANYFPIVGDVSPYVGAGFGYGYASAHVEDSILISKDRASGFAASVQAGVKFFRTSTVNLGVGIDYTVIFDENTHGNPSQFIFKVGLYY